MITNRALAYLVIANVLGGASYIAAVYALKGFSVVDSVFWRMAVAAVLLAPGLRHLDRKSVTRQDWTLMAGVGLLGYAAPLLLSTLGLTHSSATHGVLLVGMEPVAIIVLAALFLKEPFTRLKALAMGLGLSGAAMIVTQGDFRTAPADSARVWGDLVLAASGVLWGLYTVLGKPVLRRMDARAFTAVTNLIALVPLTLVALPGFLSGPGVSAVEPEAWVGLAFLALVNAAGPILWNIALETASASQTANVVFVQPLVGVLLGVLLGHDPLTAWSVVGGVLIVAGVYAATFEPS